MRMMIKLFSLIFISIQLLEPLNACANNSFFDQRYRGWIWFEEKEKEEELKPNPVNRNRELTKEEMLEVKAKNEQFKEELELLKHVMIRYPDNLEHIKRYKVKEKQMLDNAVKLSKNFVMTNFLNPDIADQLEGPQNIYGRRALKEEKDKANALELKNLSSKVELFLFMQGGCNYCEILERHLNSFAEMYGFKVEAVSADGSKSRYFKTHANSELIQQLELTKMPTVIAVTKDSKIRFELARGAVSIADLEDSSLLMASYFNEIKKKEVIRDEILKQKSGMVRKNVK